MHRDRSGTDRGVLEQHILNLAKLDSRPPQLDLIIGAAEELDSCDSPPSKITGSIQATT
jgi:hypothetical protein